MNFTETVSAGTMITVTSVDASVSRRYSNKVYRQRQQDAQGPLGANNVMTDEEIPEEFWSTQPKRGVSAWYAKIMLWRIHIGIVLLAIAIAAVVHSVSGYYLVPTPFLLLMVYGFARSRRRRYDH